jgi:hypothetical protein
MQIGESAAKLGGRSDQIIETLVPLRSRPPPNSQDNTTAREAEWQLKTGRFI